jgi:predicted AlkP superfamily pyrophosphatase or phosphodiesterase
MWLRWRRVSVLIGLTCLVAFGLRPATSAPPAAPRPRLVVLVVFDQLRADYLDRWQSLFEEGGFRRLQQDGASFRNCHYPFAFTLTGPGHASLMTGCSPAKHGIVENTWYDRATGDLVYCTTTDRYQQVPPAETNSDAKKKPAGASPDWLLVPTLGDALKEATAGRARVVVLSFKDRSAVLLAGRKPDVCCWFDTGRFVTSSCYRDALPAWVAELNRGRPADRWFGRDWTRLRPDLDYARFSGPDDVAAEGKGTGQGRTFPHPMTGGLAQPGKDYYQALYNSPFGNDLLLEVTKRAIDAEHLGRDDVPDLLCVSFSSNDPIGHCWGPDSQEVLDVTLRSDRTVRDLLAHLDARVGRGRYLLALTADHGVCPLPEVARSQGKDAGRIAPELLRGRAEEYLQKTFGQANGDKVRWIEAMTECWLYLNRRLLRERGLSAAEVEGALARWLQEQPGVQTAYTRTQLTHGLPANDVLGERVRRSFHPDRCGDVTVIVKPYYLLDWWLTGTSHGTPHPYDTHVPLLIYGPGVRAGARPEAVTPLAVAAVFARALGIKPPPGADAAVPESLQE